MTKPPAQTIWEWIDDGEYVDLDANDPAVRARYEEFVRRRNHPIPPARKADREPSLPIPPDSP
jgi:hypothetical protein